MTGSDGRPLWSVDNRILKRNFDYKCKKKQKSNGNGIFTPYLGARRQSANTTAIADRVTHSGKRTQQRLRTGSQALDRIDCSGCGKHVKCGSAETNLVNFGQVLLYVV